MEARLALGGVLAALLALLLRRNTPELALLLVLAAGMWMLGAVSEELVALSRLMGELGALAGLSDELLQPVLKTTALALLARLAAELCRGAGEPGLAAFVETAATVAALGISMPLIWAVLRLMEELLR